MKGLSMLFLGLAALFAIVVLVYVTLVAIEFKSVILWLLVVVQLVNTGLVTAYFVFLMLNPSS